MAEYQNLYTWKLLNFATASVQQLSNQATISSSAVDSKEKACENQLSDMG
jgi:hypothetical protein